MRTLLLKVGATALTLAGTVVSAFFVTSHFKNSCSERSARFPANQSSTAVRNAIPVTRAIARVAYELRPVTRASSQKN
ncbi:MAG: hypothetical protein AUI87_01890 [Actinobacteria bacterium 13_1_40CM_3_66_19]|nr:MAG: hypothetical protein AUI87_01890 [Actinobacteria bacterium 13_1_40CM_3_66_19]